MPEPTGDDWITVPTAAKVLGLQTHTVYALIDQGEIPAEVRPPAVATRYNTPGKRRSVTLRRGDVDQFIKRAKIMPGSLRHLYCDDTGPP